jgi:tetratricopeptide (TPR) repeat protein
MENSTICLTNFATTPELREVDLLARYNIMMRELVGRYKRLEKLIEKEYGRITPKLAAEFMGNHRDIVVGRERPVGFVVGNTINVTSVIFQPEDGLFWVATGSEPACNSRYVGFDFRTEMRGRSSRVKPAVLKGYRWEDDSHEKALRAYMEAFIAYIDDSRDTESIAGYLIRAREKDPREPIFSRILAEIYLHRGEYELAEAFLRESLDSIQSNNEEALVYLRLGQTCDLMGNRDEALRIYRIMIYLSEKHGGDFINGINSMVSGFARKYIKEPFRVKDIKEIPIGFSLGSVLD